MMWVVVPAAGSGRRFGGPVAKQYTKLGDRSLLEWTLQVLAKQPEISGLLVVIAADDPLWPGWSTMSGKSVVTAIGGAERCDSVIAGLQALPAEVGDQDFVLVHDAARPCVRNGDISRLIAIAGATQGGLLAAPVRDTLKQAAAFDGASYVDRTIARAGLWRAFTPQMFRRGPLVAALIAARERGEAPTDEAAAMEAAGLHPILVEGAEDNLKVTTKSDFRIAHMLLTRERGLTP